MAGPERTPVDELIERLGNRLGRTETQLEYAAVQLETANRRIQELEAELEAARSPEGAKESSAP